MHEELRRRRSQGGRTGAHHRRDAGARQGAQGRIAMRRIGAAAILPLTAAIVMIAATTQGAFSAGDRALGQFLSSECVTCHQLTGRFQGIPPIIGWPEDSFVEIMNEYRDKKRTNPVMQTIAGRLSANDIAALAAYFGSLKPAEQQKSKGGKKS